MSRMRLSPAPLLAPLLAALGCDGASPAGSMPVVDPGPSERDELALEIATTLCEGIEPCCELAALEAPSERCLRDMRNEVFIALLEAESEKRTVQMGARDACVGAFRAALAGDEVCRNAPLPRDLPRLCPELFSEIPEGTQEPGTPCEGTWQCRSPERGTRACHMRLGDTRRLCTWFVPAAPEDSCVGADGFVVECTEGSVCRPEHEAAPSERRCLPAVYDGGPCADYEGCAEGYACAYQTSTDASICVPERALDEPCWDQPDACGPEAYCPVDRGLCTLLPVNQCPMGGCPTALDRVCR